MKFGIRICFVLLLLIFGLFSSGSSSIISPVINTETPSLHCVVTPDLDSPNITWTSRTQLEPQLLENGSTAAGDHVVLNATFPDSFNITHCEMRVWSGFMYTTTRPLVVPTDPGGVFSGIIDPAQFDWVVIKGIEKDLLVSISCNFTNNDSDLMAWDGTLDQSEYTYSNNMLDMVSGDNPETDSLIWTSDNDTMVLGCLNYDCTEIGNWTLNFQVGIDAIESVNSSSIEMDTYFITGQNQTCSVCVTGYTELNESIVLLKEQVRICNFFAPNVTIYSIETLLSDDRTYNISWSCTDRNADDVNYYSVWLSRNEGRSYMLMAINLTRTWCLWNTTYWLENDYDIIRVRAFSLDFTVPSKIHVENPPTGYWPGDYRDALSWVGNPPEPSIYFYLHKDSSYFLDSTGNIIRLHIGFSRFIPAVVSYYISDNATPWIEDTFNPQTNIVDVNVSIDGLSIGYHILTVVVTAELYTKSSCTTITVIDSNHTSSSVTTSNATLTNPFVPILLQTVLVISIPVVALIVLTVLVNKGFDLDNIKRMCCLTDSHE